jgi:hypothetical protein
MREPNRSSSVRALVRVEREIANPNGKASAFRAFGHGSEQRGNNACKPDFAAKTPRQTQQH